MHIFAILFMSQTETLAIFNATDTITLTIAAKGRVLFFLHKLTQIYILTPKD